MTSQHSRTSNRPVLIGLASVVAGGLVGIVLWVLLAPVSFWAVLTPANTGQTLGVREAHHQAVAGDITLIDIRRPDEWRKTGIGDGAQPLDMRRGDFVQALGDLVNGDLTTPIALICARGVRSAIASQRLAKAGFASLVDVPEGMLGSRAGPGWLASDLATHPYKGMPQ